MRSDPPADRADGDIAAAEASGEAELNAKPSFANRVVGAALAQPLLTGLVGAVVVGVGIWSFTRLPVDAYPDLSPPMVEMITQWPGHATEEVERQVTVPIENGMNGVPNLRVMRSISLYGLSDVIMTFDDGTDNYFAREQAFERIPDITLPSGVTPSMSPLSSPSGLVYRYVLQSPDRSAMELQEHQRLGARQGVPRGAWCRGHVSARRRDDAVPGAHRSDQARRRRPEHRAGSHVARR